MSQTISGYTAIERMNAECGDAWKNYIKWSRLPQLTDLVSLDHLLCPRLIDLDTHPYEMFVEAALPEAIISDIDVLLSLPLPPDSRIVYVVVHPEFETLGPPRSDFKKCGYELLERDGNISALTNCGGFDETFLPSELNEFGLLDDLARAKKIAELLPVNNAAEPHALVDIFEVWTQVADAAK